MNSANSINVLMIGWEFPPNISGGLGTACFGLTKGLATLGGFNTTVALPRLIGGEDDQYVKLVSAGMERTCVRDPKQFSCYNHAILTDVLSYANNAQNILGQVREFDVIHAHDWLTAPTAMRIKKVSRKPLVFHVHSTEFDRSGANLNVEILNIEASALNAADMIIAVSERTRSHLTDQYRVPASRIKVVYNGVEFAPELITPLCPQKNPVITFLGRVTRQKGASYFLNAAALALQHNSLLRFVLAGDGDELASMRMLAEELKISQYVTFTGFLDSEEVQHLFRYSDAFVMPSVSEPFGIVALEAANAGVPVILSRNAGVAELLTHVIKIDHFDIKGIAQAMLDVVSDPKVAKYLGEGARKDTLEINWRRSARGLSAVYESVCYGSRSLMSPSVSDATT